MVSLLQYALLALANLLLPVAIFTFASGFFPYKPFLPGLANYETLNFGQPPKALFDKVVFMVVDALRSDFVYSEGSGFEFTQNLIRDGSAVPFTAHATSPTITMPRIKAITTGSIPSFLDVILNFAESDTSSTLATQDTWLAQMKARKDGKLVMYGDDTWIKLFPESFDRADGTSSFFVADFTEVDYNVTRHVPEELLNDDWNTMVLHYLGLDHIGHKSGPRSPNMVPKQREMDLIVRKIYEAIESKEYLANALLVVCGDHGMNDAGNHGGSAPGETSPALLFISPKFKEIGGGKKCPLSLEENFQYYTTVEQSDIVPSLGALLGFPTPRNSLGAFITEFLPLWSQRDDKIQLLYRNAKQVLGIVNATFPGTSFDNSASAQCAESTTDVVKLGCAWQSIEQKLEELKRRPDDSGDSLLLQLSKWLKDAQEIMSSAASNYDMTRLVTGLFLAAVAALFAGITIADSSQTLIANLVPFIAITIAYGIMMFASSYVEEEQHFWYWASSAWFFLLSFMRGGSQVTGPKRIGVFGLLLALRIVRRWNQTGQKFAGEPDIARTFLSQHTDLLWAFVGIAYMSNAISLGGSGEGQSTVRHMTAMMCSTFLVLLAVNFKVGFTMEDAPELLNRIALKYAKARAGSSLVTRARTIFMAIGTFLTYTLTADFLFSKSIPWKRISSLYSIHNLLVLFLMTQSRVSNIPLLLIFELQLYIIKQLDLDLIETTTTSLLLQYGSFFAFGGSNAISSIDLSSAYNGVSGYNVLAVGILTFVSNWTGPIFWASATNILLVRLHQFGERDVLARHLSLLTFFVAFSLVSVMAACTVLRAHLFIWTVFSPKYLYSMAWSLGQHLCVNVGVGSLLYWFGTR